MASPSAPKVVRHGPPMNIVVDGESSPDDVGNRAGEYGRYQQMGVRSASSAVKPVSSQLFT